MKKRQALAALAMLAAAAAPAGDPPRQAVATIFPLYDWARTIGGERVAVTQLLPAGVEAHGYAPAPRDVARIARADLFLWCGPAMEPWAADLLRGLQDRHGAAFEAARHVPPGQGAGPAAAEAAEHRHDGTCVHGAEDPHFWLDPLAAKAVVLAMADTLAEVDRAGAGEYRRRAADYARELDTLHADFTAVVARARTRTLVHAGHLAFGQFGRRYGLEFVSPFAGFSPDAEPGPRALAAIVGKIRETGARVIYHEELIEPRVARTLARETGATLRLLHGVHNVTAEERKAGATYLTLMRANLEALKAGLGVEAAP